MSADSPLTTEEQDEYVRQWQERFRAGAFGAPRLLMPLPRRIRFRLWRERRIDRAAIRLVDAGHHRAAIRLWRAFGMWRL